MSKLLFVGALLAAATPHLLAQVQFTDVRDPAGVGSDFYSSQTIHGLGINWIDFDNDDRPDMFMVNGGDDEDPHLYRNNGDGTFTNVDSLLPPLPGGVDFASSVFADYDNDGDSDIYIFTDNQQFGGARGQNVPDGPPNILLKSHWAENGGRFIPGEPLFEDVAPAAGVDDLAEIPFGPLPGMRSKTGGWVDYDRDGCVDLYVGHLVMGPAGGNIANRDRFYRNRCDGTFEDVTVASGINLGDDELTYRGALAFIAAHLDGDLWPDLYVVDVNDLQARFHRDFLFLNNADGTFTDATGLSEGLGDDSQAGMGVDVADIDLDGDWDMYITDLLNTGRDAPPKGNVLYLSNGDGTFEDNSAPQAGVSGHRSWGVNFFDVDHDGYEDFVVAKMTHPEPFLFMNNRDGTFRDVAVEAGLTQTDGRGSAIADFDHDGDLDLAIINQGGLLGLFRNDTEPKGNWLRIRPRATLSNRSAIGTLIKLQAGPMNLMRQIKSGSSTHSQDEMVAHFGLADAVKVDRIEVYWPSGAEDILTNVDPNQVLTITEGTTAAPQPHVHAIPAFVGFGATALAAQADATVRVINEGSEPLAVTRITSDNPNFWISDASGPFELAPYGGSRDVPIHFVPTTSGITSGQLSIACNDPDEPVKIVQLQGLGTGNIPLRLRLHPGRSRLLRQTP